MKKTYADECLERAAKASEGLKSDKGWDEDRYYSKQELLDCTFIAHARTDVPELARRLKMCLEFIGRECMDGSVYREEEARALIRLCEAPIQPEETDQKEEWKNRP